MAEEGVPEGALRKNSPRFGLQMLKIGSFEPSCGVTSIQCPTLILSMHTLLVMF